MALPLGKLSLIIGAGLVGSILAKEGRLPNVPDFFTGALKIAWKQLKLNDSATSSSAPKNDFLLQQVNSLRQDVELLAYNRSITIVTGERSGSGRYVVIVVVVVVGYGCVWWKGWRIGDMMFATRRGLNDACASVAKQLENVYSSISSTKRHLSSRIDHVDSKIDECADNTTATKEEVSELLGDVKQIGADVQSVHHVVRTLETKISRIEGRQSETNAGVVKLVAFAKNLENGKTVEQIEGSSYRPVLELPPLSPSRAISLPSDASLETPSPSAFDEYKSPFAPSKSSPSSTASASGLKEVHGVPNVFEAVLDDSTLQSSDRIRASEETSNNGGNNSSAGSGFLGRTFSNLFGASLLTRRRSD